MAPNIVPRMYSSKHTFRVNSPVSEGFISTVGSIINSSVSDSSVSLLTLSFVEL